MFIRLPNCLSVTIKLFRIFLDVRQQHNDISLLISIYYKNRFFCTIFQIIIYLIVKLIQKTCLTKVRQDLCCLFVLAEAGMPLSGQMLTIKLYYSLLKHSLRHLHKSRNIRSLNVVDVAILLGTILHAGCVDRLHDVVELAIYLGS